MVGSNGRDKFGSDKWAIPMKGTGELRGGRDKSGPYTRAIPMKGTGELPQAPDKCII